MRVNLLKVILSLLFINSSYSNADVLPENATDFTKRALVYGKEQMVITNNKWASKVAQDILFQGGNAFDAAIAASFVLGLTEPQSSGIGGGGYALTYAAKSKQLQAYDGREVAPHMATEKWFLNKNNQPVDFNAAMLSARSVGVPGEVALLYKLHRRQGKLKWSKLLQPAIKLAKEGFPMSPRLYKLLVADKDWLNDPAIKKVYFDVEHIKPVGSKVTNEAYARTLELLSYNPQSFYKGKIARDVINIVNQHAKSKIFRPSDLENYAVQINSPICGNYRNKYKLCSIPPSSGGGVAVLELMKIFEKKYQGGKVNDLEWVYTFSQASKLAFADRDQYLADPKFVKQPVKGLLSDKYIDSRSQLITNKALMAPVEAGIPEGANLKYAPYSIQKLHGTTSIAIVDKDGNAISMTLSVEHQFGSHIFVDGFFLNNQLTDFSFIPTVNNKLVANRVEKSKRPRSSIAPVLAFKDGELELIVGSPGGSAIICYVAKNLIQVLDFNMSVDKAISSSNLCAPNKELIIEKNSKLTKNIKRLQQMGESVVVNELVSGVTSIQRSKKDYGWYGAADPRREGVALGR